MCAERNDLACVARLFTDYITVAQRNHDYVTEAMLHNALTWTAWGKGDYAGALAENEECTRVIMASPVSDADKRSVNLHYWWDRAYLLVDIAVTKPHDREAMRQAEDARRRFKQLASHPDDADSVAVLDAYFYARTNDGKNALRSARLVDLARDRDVQDWYCVEVALVAGGDVAKTADCAVAFARTAYDYPMKPLIVRQLDKDAGK